MDLMSLLADLVPVPIVAFIIGFTEALKKWLGTEVEDPATKQVTVKLPKWFLLLPAGMGMLAGVIHFYVSTPSETLNLMNATKHVLTSIEMGIGYGGAAVLLYEFKERFLTKKTP